MANHQQYSDSDMAAPTAPSHPSAPSSSASRPDSSSPSPLAQSLAAAHSMLPKELFWQLLDSTVLPHLDRLSTEQQTVLREAVERATTEERRKQARLYAGQLMEACEEAQTYKELHELIGKTLRDLQSHAEEQKERFRHLLLSHATARLCFLNFTQSGSPSDLPPLILALLSLSRHDFTRITLQGIFKREIVASAHAIIHARDAEFPYVLQALDSLVGHEPLLEELPEVKLGEPGWKEKERERRTREDEVEELMERFASRVRPEYALGAEGREGETGWRYLMEPEDEEQPSDGDRELGNTLYGWLEVWQAWPVRKEVEMFGPRLWNLGRQGHLAFKRAVVTELCSMVSKRRRGYESRTTNLRDGMWVLMLAVCTEDMGIGAPRIGYHF